MSKIKSMTGFGKAEAMTDGRKITVEIRSLNSKQLDLSIRMPSAWREAECEIRNIVSRKLQRGKVEVYVSVESAAADTSVKIDPAVFKSYVRQISDALAYSGIDASYDAILPAVMRLPDVVSASDNTVRQNEVEALLAVTEEAASRLDAFRTQEGATLIADILKRIDLIEAYRSEVVPFETARADVIRNRIR